MALLHALNRYKEDGLIRDFELLDDKVAQVTLCDDSRERVFMNDEYILGESAIIDAGSSQPPCKYVVYNAWDQVTNAAKDRAKKLGIQVMSFGEFSHELERKRT